MATHLNGERLDPEWIARERALLAARYRAAGRPIEPGQLETDAHANAVEKLLLRQRARKAVPTVPRRDVQRRLDRQAKEFGGIAGFYRHLGLAPSDGERLREELREEIRYDRYMALLCRDVPPPDESELRASYDAHPDAFRQPEMVHAAHMVIRRGPHEDQLAIQLRLRNARESLRQQPDALRGVPEFQSPNGILMADLGYFPRGQLDDDFDRVVFAMQPGAVSDVFQTSVGYHVAVVYDRTPERPLSFEESRNALREQMWVDRKNERIGRCVDRFLKESVVEEREDG